MIINIEADKTTVSMGGSIKISLNGGEEGHILLPFINGRRWGHHERPDASGKAQFLLPLPNPGAARIQVAAIQSDTGHWMGLGKRRDLLLAGSRLPDGQVTSNIIDIEITWRAFAERRAGKTLFGIQWESWFTHGVRGWETAQAVPVVGFYNLYNRDVIRQHVLWFMDLGVDFIFPDWTNHLWGLKHWDERPERANEIVHATTLTLEVLAEMRDEGLPVPTMVLFSGLSNGHPATMEALNEELAWIYHTYVRNPRFKGLWLEYEGKPLIVILDTGALGDPRGTAESSYRIPFIKDTLEMSEAELDEFRKNQVPVDDSQFTVRWMSSQNQTTRHHELGYWSWMDGVIDPPVTYRTIDGVAIAEAVTVTPAFFGAQGWTASDAYGRRGGATIMETFKPAFKHRPRFIFLHQFNEFTGQIEGEARGPDKDIYGDTYNVELSDDLEPVSISAPGYRGDAGGWGFYYLNLTKALMDLYRNPNKECTLLVVTNPLRGATITGETVDVAWSIFGKAPQHYTVLLDGRVALDEFTGHHTTISLDQAADGPHTISVLANGTQTFYRLSMTELEGRLDLLIPAQVDVPIMLRRSGA